MKKYILILFLVLLSFIPNIAFSADKSGAPIISFFDMSVVMSCDSIIDIDTQIKKIHEEHQKKLNSETREFQKEYESIINNSLLSDEAKDKKRQELDQKAALKQQEWKQKGQKLQEEINAVNNTVSNNIKEILAKVAKEKSIDIIIAKPPFQPSYIHDAYDLTNLIKSRLNKELSGFSVKKYIK